MPRNRKRKRSKKPKEPNSPSDATDLFIPVPQSVALIPLLLSRLATTGYTTCALTHTIYGRPRDADSAGTVFHRSILQSTDAVNGLRMLKRLHVVVETVADVGLHTGATSPIADLLRGYDIVALCPRNEATFQAACSSATCDIISIDYASVQPMFACRPVALHQAKARGLALEIPYAPALLQPRSRRALLSVCRDFHRAGVRRLVVSSGSRKLVSDDIADVGTRALRMPGDVANLVHTVMGFTGRVSAASLQGLNIPSAVNKKACWLIRQAPNSDDTTAQSTTTSEEMKNAAKITRKIDEKDHIPDDDGFIAF